jgi:hypothetical protein
MQKVNLYLHFVVATTKMQLSKKYPIMDRVLKDPAFVTVLNELKGTHSMQKFATDMAKKKGNCEGLD